MTNDGWFPLNDGEGRPGDPPLPEYGEPLIATVQARPEFPPRVKMLCRVIRHEMDQDWLWMEPTRSLQESAMPRRFVTAWCPVPKPYCPS